MKKILSYLAGLAIVTGGVSPVVSCAKNIPANNDQKDVDDIASQINKVFKNGIVLKIASNNDIVLTKNNDISSLLENAIAKNYNGNFNKLLGNAKIISSDNQDIKNDGTLYTLSLEVKLNNSISKSKIENIKIQSNSELEVANRVFDKLKKVWNSYTNLTIISDKDIVLKKDQIIDSGVVFDALSKSYGPNFLNDLEGSELIFDVDRDVTYPVNGESVTLNLRVKVGNTVSTESLNTIDVSVVTTDRIKADNVIKKFDAKWPDGTTINVISSKNLVINPNQIIKDDLVYDAIKKSYGPNFENDLDGAEIVAFTLDPVIVPVDGAKTAISFNVKVGNTLSSISFDDLYLKVTSK